LESGAPMVVPTALFWMRPLSTGYQWIPVIGDRIPMESCAPTMILGYINLSNVSLTG
jgi:hypothetical protein